MQTCKICGKEFNKIGNRKVFCSIYCCKVNKNRKTRDYAINKHGLENYRAYLARKQREHRARVKLVNKTAISES